MKRGEYTARIEACRAELLARKEADIVRPTEDYGALFTADYEAIEARIEREILAKFGGYDAMVETFEAERAGETSITVAEAIAHLRSLQDE